MSIPVENPVDVDLFSNLHNDSEVQTSTDKHSAKDAVIRKCLHPPSAVPEFSGLPTNDARTQVVIEWRNMEVMSSPRVYDKNPESPTFNKCVELTSDQLKTYDYGFLMPTGARVKHIGFVRNTTDPLRRMEQDNAGVGIEQLYDFVNWRADANLYRPVAKSTTIYPNMTMFNNTGMVVGNQFNPNILFAGSLIALSNENPALFYKMVSTLFQMGSVKVTREPEKIERWFKIPHYHRTEVLKNLNLSPTDHLDLDPNTNHQVIGVGKLSPDSGVQNFPTSSQILGNSLRSYGGKATDGAFSIQRLNTITPAWLAGSNTFNSPQPYEISGLYQCWKAEVMGGTNEIFMEPFYENSSIGTPVAGARALYDTLWSKDMTWSYVLFTGLSLNPQPGTMSNLLIKKTYSIYEVQPCMASAWAGMIKLGPKPDLMVMEAMMDGFFELKDVMPAKYNFWGTIASLASSGLRTFGTSLLTQLASKLAKGGSSKSTTKVSKKSTDNDTKTKGASGNSNDKVKSLERQLKQLTQSVSRMGVDRTDRDRRLRRRRGYNNLVPAEQIRTTPGMSLKEYMKRNKKN